MGIAAGVEPLPGLRAATNGLPVLPPVTFVQVANIGTSSPVLTRSISLVSPSTTGNTLLCCLHFFGPTPATVMTPIVSVNDGTNTLAAVPGSTATNVGSTYWLQTSLFYVTGIAGKATETVTVTVTVAGYIAMDLFELSPAVASQASGNTGSGTVLSVGTITPPVNGSLTVMVGTNEGGGSSWTPSAGWTLVGAQGAQYIVQAAAAALTGTLTFGSIGKWTASAAVLIG